VRYRVRCRKASGYTFLVHDVYETRRDAESYAAFGNRHCGAEYTVEEVLDVSNAGEARSKAFQAWMEEEDGKTFLGTLRETHRDLATHVLLRAFTAGERHGRAQLDAILSHGRREA